jgi:hypothetical protein
VAFCVAMLVMVDSSSLSTSHNPKRPKACKRQVRFRIPADSQSPPLTMQRRELGGVFTLYDFDFAPRRRMRWQHSR